MMGHSIACKEFWHIGWTLCGSADCGIKWRVTAQPVQCLVPLADDAAGLLERILGCGVDPRATYAQVAVDESDVRDRQWTPLGAGDIVGKIDLSRTVPAGGETMLSQPPMDRQVGVGPTFDFRARPQGWIFQDGIRTLIQPADTHRHRF